ncbi:MAG: DUF1800 family protein [Chloroflexi bacterium]|nr:DUF1800 family protein [Chloroflexota bacterium]
MGFLWSAFRMDRRTFLKAMTTAAAAAAAHHFRWAGVIPVRAAQDTAAGPALHILNRATWGPTPADLAAINERGIAGWLDWQLDYESIPDPAIDAFLRENAILLQSYEELSAAATVDYGNVMNRFLWGRIIRAAFSTRQALRAHGGVLDGSLQRPRSGFADGEDHRRPRGDPPPRAGQLPRPAARVGHQPRHADLSRQYVQLFRPPQRELRPRTARTAHAGRRRGLHGT